MGLRLLIILRVMPYSALLSHADIFEGTRCTLAMIPSYNASTQDNAT